MHSLSENVADPDQTPVLKSKRWAAPPTFVYLKQILVGSMSFWTVQEVLQLLGVYVHVTSFFALALTRNLIVFVSEFEGLNLLLGFGIGA